MKIDFQLNDPSLESQWRALILFGKNSATYKFAFAKALLEVVSNETTSIILDDLAKPFVHSIINHLKQTDKQGSSQSSKFLNACRSYIQNEISSEELYAFTIKYGFVNVVDAFQNVNGGVIPNKFYEKNYGVKKELIITDDFLKIKGLYQFRNLEQEVEARWNLVETAWSLNINRNLLEVKFDYDKSLLYIKPNEMRRIDITSVRDALNGYQKGKCFYTRKDISINKKDNNRCAVDHFLPHINKIEHQKSGANINGVWNLVLADAEVNNNKSAQIPEKRFLKRLYIRNEYYIQSNHPLSETIINQTGRTAQQRQQFLEQQYNLALSLSIHTWKPKIELLGEF